MVRVAASADRLARPVAALSLGLAVVLVSLALGVGLFAERAPARSRPDGSRLLQLNMCGNVCNHDRPVAGVVGAITGYRPEAVSLNEVCRGQLGALVAGLGRSGWAMQARFLVTAPGACSGDDYGIAVLTRSHVLDDDSWTYAQQSPGTVERRGLLCLQAAIGGRPSEVCSTHLVSQDGDPTGGVRGAQVAEAATVVTSFALPVVLMGDFNLAPHDSELDPLYGGSGARALDEVDQCRCGPATHRSGSKLDYVFVSSLDFAVHDVTVARTGFSDHEMLRAVVAVR